MYISLSLQKNLLKALTVSPSYAVECCTDPEKALICADSTVGLSSEDFRALGFGGLSRATCISEVQRVKASVAAKVSQSALLHTGRGVGGPLQLGQVHRTLCRGSFK